MRQMHTTATASATEWRATISVVISSVCGCGWIISGKRQADTKTHHTQCECTKLHVHVRVHTHTSLGSVHVLDTPLTTTSVYVRACRQACYMCVAWCMMHDAWYGA